MLRVAGVRGGGRGEEGSPKPKCHMVGKHKENGCGLLWPGQAYFGQHPLKPILNVPKPSQKNLKPYSAKPPNH